MVNNEDFSIRLKKVMDYYGLTATAFADEIQIQRSSISHLLSGRNKPSLDFVMKVLQKYPEVELYWLLKGKGVFPKQQQNHLTKEVATPNLFKENAKKDIESTKISTETIIKEKSHTDREIEQILFFYTDGSFKKYTPQ